MSRAFTKEDGNEDVLAGIGERPVSTNRNLVTARGLAAMDEALASLRSDLAAAEQAGDRQKIALASRDLRYWAARRETAELSVPDRDTDVVRFGTTVVIEDEDGHTREWTIVGEDEADAASGTISHVSPVARALFGKPVGEGAEVGGRRWEIAGITVREPG